MKKMFLLFFVFFSISIYCQNIESDYFSFHKGGKKYLRPIKYVLFNSEKDKKNVSAKKKYFHIGETFIYSKDKHKIDTCNIKFLKTIKLSNPYNLANDEYEFFKKKIKEDAYWKTKKYPMPLVKFHPYFKVCIIEKHKGKILKYEVDWNYTRTRGFKIK